MRRPNKQRITKLAPKFLKRYAHCGLMCTEKDCGAADASGIIDGQKDPDQIEIHLRANNRSPMPLSSADYCWRVRRQAVFIKARQGSRAARPLQRILLAPCGGQLLLDQR